MTTEPDAPRVDEVVAPANEAQLFPPSPKAMADEALAVFVRDGIKKFSKLLPFVRELKGRFHALPRGHANIMECRTWKEFCEKVLDRSPSAVRKALAEKNVLLRPKKLLLAAIERMLPICYQKIRHPGRVEELAIMRFSISENGHLLLRGGIDGNIGEEEIPEARVLKPGGPGIIVEPERADFGCVNFSSDPFDFELNVLFILGALQLADNDPAIFFRGRGKNLEFRFSSLYAVYAMPRTPTEPRRPIPRSDPEPAADPEPPGEFLAKLKPGDHVAIGSPECEHAVVAEVLIVTDSAIEVGRKGKSKTFDRNGRADDFSILRIATPEDLALEAERNEEERRRQVELHRYTELNQQVKDLVKRIPNSIRTEGSACWSGGITVTFDALTLEQLEKIVEALQLEPAHAGTVDSGTF